MNYTIKHDIMKRSLPQKFQQERKAQLRINLEVIMEIQLWLANNCFLRYSLTNV